MPTSSTLGQHFQSFVRAPFATGRSHDASEALRLMEDREWRMAAMDAAVARGMDDVRTGRVRDADAVVDRLEAKDAGMSQDTGEA